jgi:hypothetical protein
VRFSVRPCIASFQRSSILWRSSDINRFVTFDAEREDVSLFSRKRFSREIRVREGRNSRSFRDRLRPGTQ